MKSILRTLVVLAAAAAIFPPAQADAQLTTTSSTNTTNTLSTVKPTVAYVDDTSHQLSLSGSHLIGDFPGLSGAWAKVLISSANVGSDYQNIEISLVPQSQNQTASIMNFEIHAPAGTYHARFTFQLYASASLVVKTSTTTLATCNMTTSAPTCDVYFDNPGVINPSASLTAGSLAQIKSVTIAPTTLVKQ